MSNNNPRKFPPKPVFPDLADHLRASPDLVANAIEHGTMAIGFDRIKEIRRELLRQGAHIEALHLGSRAEKKLNDEWADITGTHEPLPPIEKFMGIPLETPPERGQPTPDYCAFSWKREARSPAILFEVIQP